VARRASDALLSLARLAASSGGDPVSALPVAARLGARILGADRVVIRSLKAGLKLGRESDSFDQLSGPIVAFRQHLAHGMLSAGDVSSDGRLLGLQPIGFLDSSACSIIAAPVRVGAETVAVVLGESLTPRQWSADNLAEAGTVAELVALILEPALVLPRHSDDRYRSLIESTVDGMVLIDAKTGALVDANRAFRRLVGLPSGDLDGFLAADLLADPTILTEQVERLLAESGEWRCETTLRFLSHAPVEVEINSHIANFDGRPTLCAVVRALAPRRRAERLEHDRATALELIARNEPLDAILNHLQSMVESQCPGLHCSILMEGEASLERLRAARLEAFSTSIPAANGGLHGYVTARGSSAVVDEDCSAVFRAAATLAGIALDQRQLTERLAFQAQHDVLTGLPNRRLFEERMRFSLANARRRKAGMALLFVDLDHFKPINDTLGHDAGDQLLRLAAERIAGAVRATDTVARMGGDEFTIILQDITGAHSAGRVAEKVLAALKMPFRVMEQDLSITGSIGISLYPQDGSDSVLLQRHADVAMYRAKSSGGNAYRWFTTEMNNAASERQQVEMQLRRVIEKGELSLFYQTQVSLDGTTHGVEAFVRWHHPQLGFVLPAHFIPVAEECGLIVPIGAWVLREACRQFMDWRRMGAAPDKLSINISGVQFAQPDFARTVGDILQESGVEPARIELEVTESLLMRDFEKSIERLAELRKLGVSVAIDDFGTGQFSLNHLHQLPVDALKVDPSFVKDLGRPGTKQGLVETILALAKSLHLRVVAEGVESEEQLTILRALGCDRAQGYLFGPAVVATDLLPKLRSSIPPPRRPKDDVARERAH
jgi:diguanylate cyclase (GGDEF)-like protein/PAS domain S-box-containing protein